MRLGKVIRCYLQQGQEADEIIHWTLGVLSKSSFCYQCHCFYSCKGTPLRWGGGIPCFSNRRLQELEKSVISNTATLRGPVPHADHRFFNQSISRYVLIAYYVQRRFTRSSRKASPASRAFLWLPCDGQCCPNLMCPQTVWRPWKNAAFHSGGLR